MQRPPAGSKLRFSVAHATGEDPDYPARELHFHTPQTREATLHSRGWQCARFSKFPQELVLRLDHPARIHQIQLLSHEYKIATKIELYTGLLPPGETSLDRAVMRRLGHLSFDANTASGHQARELKSVHVNVDAVILRVVVHKCHVNKLNIYNQVGIVALNVIGEPIASPMGGGMGGMMMPNAGPVRPRPAGVADVALDLDVDPVTAVKIREIHQLKEEAVAREDYDEAKRLRDGINRLKAVGAKVAQLEARKRAAVEAEDYDAAKVIKSEIDKLRSAGGVTALGESVGVGGGGGGGVGGPGGGGPDDIFNRALEANGGMSPGAGGGGHGHGESLSGGVDNMNMRAQTPQGDMGYDPPVLDGTGAPGLSPAQIAEIRATAGGGP